MKNVLSLLVFLFVAQLVSAQSGQTFPLHDSLKSTTPAASDSSLLVANTAFVTKYFRKRGDSTWPGGYYPFSNPLGFLRGNQTVSLTGDATGSGATSIAVTLPSINSSVGTFGNTTQVPVVVVNAKGQVTSVNTVNIAFPVTATGNNTLSGNNTFSGTNTFSASNTFSANNTFNALQLFAGGINGYNGTFLVANHSIAFSHATTFYYQKVQEASGSYTGNAFYMDGTNRLMLMGADPVDSAGNLQVGGVLTVIGTSAFIGAVTLPTAARGTSTTQAATTAYVMNQASGGAYIPTLTGGSNYTSPTADSCFYTRVGNIVTVTGHLSLSATTAATWGVVYISLPVSSYTTSRSGWGVANGNNSGGSWAYLQSGSSANGMGLNFEVGATGVTNFYFTFSYIVQ